jgi:D-threo-aldose 1-dehydrogenase
VLAVGVFNSGLLASPKPSADSYYEYGAVPADVLARAERLAAVCAEYGVELPTAALRYPLREPAVRSVVIGAAAPDHVRQNLERLRVDIPDELWQRLADEGLAP